MAGSSRTLDVILYIDRRRQLMEVGCGLSIIRDLHASLLQKARFATCQSLFRRSSRWESADLLEPTFPDLLKLLAKARVHCCCDLLFVPQCDDFEAGLVGLCLSAVWQI